MIDTGQAKILLRCTWIESKLSKMLFVLRYCQPAGDDHCVGPCERRAPVPGHRVERHEDQAHPPTDHQQVCFILTNSVADPECLSHIPDPTFFQSGSELFPSRIRIKEFKYFNPKKWFVSSRKYDPGFLSGSRIRILTIYPSRVAGSIIHRIPDPQH